MVVLLLDFAVLIREVSLSRKWRMLIFFCLQTRLWCASPLLIEIMKFENLLPDVSPLAGLRSSRRGTRENMRCRHSNSSARHNADLNQAQAKSFPSCGFIQSVWNDMMKIRQMFLSPLKRMKCKICSKLWTGFFILGPRCHWRIY